MKKLLTLLLFSCFVINNINSQVISINTYDSLHRLEKVIKSDGNTIIYQYDEVGNRIGIIVTNNQANDVVDNLLSLDIKLYPNPTSKSFCISGFEDRADLILTDMSGKVMLAKQVSNKEIVSISSLPNGIYIVQLITNTKVINKKLVKN